MVKNQEKNLEKWEEEVADDSLLLLILIDKITYISGPYFDLCLQTAH